MEREEIETGKESKKKEIESGLCAELEIIKVFYVLFSILTNYVIFNRVFSLKCESLFLFTLSSLFRKVFFEFVLVFNKIIFGRLFNIFVSSVIWNIK